jgi:hypothetical protein
MASALDNSEGAPTSTPDWTRPYGVTTPRTDVPIPKQASGYPTDDPAPKVPVEDRGQRTESVADLFADDGPYLSEGY